MIVNAEHGSLYDRGSADSYYKRPANPHYYPDQGVGHSEPVTDLTESQIREYMCGYFNQEASGDHKDYGNDEDCEGK